MPNSVMPACQVSRITSDTQVVTGNAWLYGVDVRETGGANLTIQIYDNTSAVAASERFSRNYVAGESSGPDVMRVPMETGIFVDFTGTGTAIIYWDDKP